MKKTIGGDRLGSGAKMKVDLHNYGRSTHDMGYVWRSTMAAGTLVPFLCEVALPGDTFDINLGLDVKTHPTIGPLFGSYKAQIDLFSIPIRLYNSHLHNNTLDIGRKMSLIKLPQMTLYANDTTNTDWELADADNIQVNPSALPSYLGIRGIGRTAFTPTGRNFNCIPLLAYWEIYKQYYANKQEGIGAVLHTPSQAVLENVDTVMIDGNTIVEYPTAQNPILMVRFTNIIVNATTGNVIIPSQILFLINGGWYSMVDLCGNDIVVNGETFSGTYNYNLGSVLVENWRYQTAQDIGVGTPSISTFPLDNIDVMRSELMKVSSYDPVVLNNMTIQLEPYKWIYEQPNGIPNILSSQEGLALKTYQSDLFNNWIKTDWIDGVDGITAVTAVSTAGGSFTLDTLNLSQKVYDMLNRIAISGGSYDDWQDAVYMHERYRKVYSPVYVGGLIKEVVFQEVVSLATTETDVNQPLGTLAGKGMMAKKHKGGTVVIKVDEPSYIMGIVSLTPRVDYSQGNKWDVNLETLDDLHKPALDEIGFQELITDQMAWWDTEWDGSQWVKKSAGKQPAWMNYMTNVNQVRGNFAIKNNEMFMVLNRRYTPGIDGIQDLTTYIDPSKFNFIFAQTSLDSQNFWTQIGIDMIVRRKMSAKIMPNL